MIECVTFDNKAVSICDKEAKAVVVGTSVIIQKGDEVFMITPITNIKFLWKGEDNSAVSSV